MNSPLIAAPTSFLGGRRLREPYLLLLILLVACIHLGRLTAPNLRGEETRRGRVAVEMIQTGDWVAPRQQGELFFSRPPLQNWLIALVGMARGGVDAVAIRLPSALAVIFTAALIYCYARLFVGPAAALAAGLAFASMGQVLELGRLGETESLFTFLIAGSLLLWHGGDEAGWSGWATWGVGYCFAALGMLTKGAQAPVYFVASVAIYLLLARRWRELFSWRHAAGVALFALVWGAWQGPYYLQEGAAASIRMYSNDVGLRFVDTSWKTIFEHLGVYPLEIAACMLPWSPLLIALLMPSFWRALGRSRSAAVFLVVCLAVTFPSCWLVPGARSRYFMPLYPCAAVLAGLVAEQCWAPLPDFFWRGSWRRFLVAMAGLMAVAAFVVPVLPFIPAAAPAAPPAAALSLGVVLLLLAAVTWNARRATDARRRLGGIVAPAAFVALLYMVCVTNLLVAASNDPARQVAALKAKLPPDAKLVSVGLLDHVFTYHFKQPIEPITWSETSTPWPSGADYVCFTPQDGETPRFDAPWEKVAVINCDRNRGKTSGRKVIVARRAVPQVADAGGDERAR
jgi:4-amino-4-deoxy-L-arabinose transferase-like glycosyltransferase